MKKIILVFFLMNIIFLTGCSTKKYTIDQVSYDELNDYINNYGGKQYLEYVENDKSLTKRDKATRISRFNNIKDLIIEIGK